MKNLIYKPYFIILLVTTLTFFSFIQKTFSQILNDTYYCNGIAEYANKTSQLNVRLQRVLNPDDGVSFYIAFVTGVTGKNGLIRSDSRTYLMRHRVGQNSNLLNSISNLNETYKDGDFSIYFLSHGEFGNEPIVAEVGGFKTPAGVAHGKQRFLKLTCSFNPNLYFFNSVTQGSNENYIKQDENEPQ